MIEKIVGSVRNLSIFERALWIISLLTVAVSYMFVGSESVLSLVASLIGVTALIFVAKGDVLGQIITVCFSLFYAFISYTFKYYGEMITYLFMTSPMAVLSVISWIKHPYIKSEVRVNHLSEREIIFMLILSVIVTGIFYAVLKAFDTANLAMSTISITTSFIASYLTFRRSEFYALGYAANDVVLIILWIMATVIDTAYLPMIICFIMFFINDLYGFFNWSEMKKRQHNSEIKKINQVL